MDDFMNKDLHSDILTNEIYENVNNKLERNDKKPCLAIIVVGDKKDSSYLY